jgi:hypothetical protein
MLPEFECPVFRSHCIRKVVTLWTFLRNLILVIHTNEWLKNFYFYFLKHCRSKLIVTKYYAKLLDNKEGNERLNKNMNSCEYFGKNLYCDANFSAKIFSWLDKICISIRLNYENLNLRKNWLCIFQFQFRRYLQITHLSHGFNTSVDIWFNVLRSACTLDCLRKIGSWQVSSWTMFYFSTR